MHLPAALLLSSASSRRATVGMCAAAVLVGGCASAAPQTDPPSEAVAHLPQLPACTDRPEGSGDALPEGARVPEGTVVTVVRETGPFTQVNGYVPATPVEVLARYESFEDLTVLVREHEVVEAELLVTDGTTRSFVKAVSVCESGSALAVVLAPESESEALPVPERAGAPDQP